MSKNLLTADKKANIVLRAATLFLLSFASSCLMAQVSKSGIMSAMELANDYFIAKYPDAGAPTFVKKQRPSNLWTPAAVRET